MSLNFLDRLCYEGLCMEFTVNKFARDQQQTARFRQSMREVSGCCSFLCRIGLKACKLYGSHEVANISLFSFFFFRSYIAFETTTHAVIQRGLGTRLILFLVLRLVPQTPVQSYHYDEHAM